mmetsp:Transcript_109541/g.172718  ORF Transcript_109541/g.172718 Transcript_109541/m.172718 type:complete len:1170 (-) Transcript_109541:174-3683(-)|eukprot:CAMPEP_0169095954 /NCGR_PEP_ID=MMETSP1015-20121227/18746_1 /TAXON_ID=342587 /ORGANISM="Karlodinium micrum, Strain CCMP2283" /LENGTH=1169 /DNA_ID=CAMNT_0009156697 /DNA_START=42 /DNA_END=3551 /DNA_ORIENTATION=+
MTSNAVNGTLVEPGAVVATGSVQGVTDERLVAKVATGKGSDSARQTKPGEYGAALVRKDFTGDGVDLQRGDGAVLAAAKEYDEKEKQSILATFNKWDVAGDGFITEAELRRVLTGLGVKGSQVKAIFQEVDKNKDNKIDYKEFIQWCYNSAPLNIKASATTIRYPLQLGFLEMELHRNIAWDWWSHDMDLAPYVIFKHPTDKKKVYFTSPSGRGLRSELKLDRLQDPLAIDFTSEAGNDVVAIDMYIYRTVRGSKFVGSGQIRLADVAPEVAKGFGKTRKFTTPVFDKLRDPKTGRDVEVKTGQLHLILAQPGFVEGWETLKVQEYKRDKLPPVPGPNEVKAVLESLTVCGDDQMERTILQMVESQAVNHTRGFLNHRPDELGKILDSIETWLKQCEAVAMKNKDFYARNKDKMDKAKASTATDVLQTLQQSSNNSFTMLRVCIKFAVGLDPKNSYLPGLAHKLTSYLGIPAETPLDKLLAAAEVDNKPADPKQLGLTLESDADKPPDISDDLRYGIRDLTIRRVLGMLNYQVSRDDKRKMTNIYETEGEDLMEMKGLTLPKLVIDLLSKVTYFCGEKYIEQMTIPEMMLTRNRDPEALLQRFDVVAIPTMAEYDKDWKPLVDPKTRRNIAFFGENPAQPIGGHGWFWILHAAAINVGESDHAEDFDEYSRPATDGVGRWLDEEHYFQDMDALWLNALRAAKHLGIKDFIAFPFGMGAFLRNLSKLDSRYYDDNMMRRLRKGVAAGLYKAMVQVNKDGGFVGGAGGGMVVHVCLIDCDLESRSNHNVFIEAAAEKVKEVPSLATLIKIHRNVDCLHLANLLASRPPQLGDTDTAPRKVGMLNGANNKLLGNHWFSSGARKAIDENFHRRSGAMCIAGLLLNQATKAEKRGYLELKDNVDILGGTIVQMLPPEGCGRRFVELPPRKPRPGSGGKFLSKVTVAAYGVLGIQMTKTGSSKNVAPEPTADMAIFDPAGLPYIRSGPGGAGGASGVIYRWLGLDKQPQFPDVVKEAVKAPTDAKFFAHPGKCIVIHTVGPNFSEERGLQQDEAVQRLALTYTNALKEVAASGASKLRMLPVSSAIFAGSFSEQMPEMTAEALEKSFAELDKDIQDQILSLSALEMCIFEEKQVEVYEELFTTGVRKKEKTDAGRGTYQPRGHDGRDRRRGRGRH